jgi:hypothetical protein
MTGQHSVRSASFVFDGLRQRSRRWVAVYVPCVAALSLVQAADPPHDATGVTAASTLAVLADGNLRMAEVLASPANLSYLVQRLRSEVPGLPWRVAAIVGRLAASSASIEAAFIDAGGLAELGSLLESSDAYAQAKATTVLGSIASRSSKQRASVVALGLAPLVLQLASSHSSDVRLAAVRLLAMTAADDPACRAVVGSAEGIRALFGTGQDGLDGTGDGQQPPSARSSTGLVGDGRVETAMWAAAAVRRAVDGGSSGERCEEPARYLVDAGGVRALVSMLTSGERNNVIAAAALVGALGRCTHPAICAALTDAGMVVGMVDLLCTTDSEIGVTAVQTQILQSLRTMASASFAEQICRAGATPPTVAAVSVPETRTPALTLLATLATHRSCQGALAEAGAARAAAIVLRQLLTSPAGGAEIARSSALAEAAVLMLTRIAEADDSGRLQGLLVHEGLTKTLPEFLDEDIPVNIRLQCMAALGAIAKGNARAQTAIMEAGGLDGIVATLANPEVVLHQKAAATLVCFQKAPNTVQCRMLQQLLSLIESGGSHGQYRAVLLLGKFGAAGLWSHGHTTGKSRFRHGAKKIMAMHRWQRQVERKPQRGGRRKERQRQERDRIAEQLKRVREKFDEMDQAREGVLNLQDLGQLVSWVFESFHLNGVPLSAEQVAAECTKLDEINGRASVDFHDFAAWLEKSTRRILKERRSAACQKRTEAKQLAPAPELQTESEGLSGEQKAAYQFIELLEKDIQESKTLDVVLAWLSDEQRHWMQAVRSLDVASAGNAVVRSELLDSGIKIQLVIELAARHVLQAMLPARDLTVEQHLHRVSSLLNLVKRTGCRRAKMVVAVALTTLAKLCDDKGVIGTIIECAGVVSLSDMQLTTITVFKHDGGDGDLAAMARQAMAAIFRHSQDLETVTTTLGSLVELLRSHDASPCAGELSGPKVNATLAISDLIIKISDEAELACHEAALEVLSEHQVLEMMYAVVSKVTDAHDLRKRRYCAAALSILYEMIRCSDSQCKSLVHMGGDIQFFTSLNEQFVQLENVIAPVLALVKDFHTKEQVTQRLLNKELHDAALKLQRQWRQHMTRKEAERLEAQRLNEGQRRAKRAKRGRKAGNKKKKNASARGKVEAPVAKASVTNASVAKTKGPVASSSRAKVKSQPASTEQVAKKGVPSKSRKSQFRASYSGPLPDNRSLDKVNRSRLKEFNERMDASRRLARQKREAKRLRDRTNADSAALGSQDEWGGASISGWAADAMSRTPGSPVRLIQSPAGASSARHRYEEMSGDANRSSVNTGKSLTADEDLIREGLEAPITTDGLQDAPISTANGTPDAAAAADVAAAPVETSEETLDSHLVDEIFAHLDQDGDGLLQHADMVRLDEKLGVPTSVDDAGWHTLCHMLGDVDPTVGLELAQLQLFFVKAGPRQLNDAHVAVVQTATTEPASGAASTNDTPTVTDVAPPRDMFAEMVADIFAHYDVDGRGVLQHAELSRLEEETGDEGVPLDVASYEALCNVLAIKPSKGLSLDDLTRFYAMDSTDLPRSPGCLSPRNESELAKAHHKLFGMASSANNQK